MKKLLVLFLVLAITAGHIAAQDEDIGLSLGLEFGIENVNKANEEERYPYIAPMLVFDRSFLNNFLDIYTELDYFFFFKKDEVDKVYPQLLYFDLSLGFNLGLTDTSTLSIILENENEYFLIVPRIKGANNVYGIIKPGVKYSQMLHIGDIYSQIDLPIQYISYNKDDEFWMGLDLTFGMYTDIGFGLKTTGHLSFKPEFDYYGLDVILSYENDFIYGELEINTPKKFSDGITATPEINFFFIGFTLYANCMFEGIGNKDSKIVISPAAGLKFSF